MRILFINQFYWPDAAATSQLLTDVTRALAAEGHEVEVVCSKGSYASVEVADNAPATKVHRLVCAPYLRGRVGRCLSYLSFFFGCLWKGLRIPKVDLVVTMTTPPLSSVIGGILQRVKGPRHFIWVMDLFPEALVDVGIFRPGSLVIRSLHWASDWSYRQADAVVAIGECMRHRLVERRISEDKLCIAENWADGREIFPIARNREGPLVIMYSGNLGLSHDIDTLLFAMKCLSGDPRFHFRFVGGGQRQRMVQAFCEEHNLQNVEFLPYCTRSKLAESLSQADIGLVTQRAESAGSVVPSKLYGLMAAGRPILYIGPRKTTPFWIIERFQCGWHADCGDGPRLVTLLEELHARPDLVQSAGVRARNAFLREYDLPQGVSRICNLFGAAVRPEVVAREPAAQTTLEGT